MKVPTRRNWSIGNPPRMPKSRNAKAMIKKRIAVVGMGYVGVPAAVLLANAGHDVTGIQRGRRGPAGR